MKLARLPVRHDRPRRTSFMATETMDRTSQARRLIAELGGLDGVPRATGAAEVPSAYPHMAGAYPHMASAYPHMASAYPHMAGAYPHMAGAYPHMASAR
ncbi:MAG: hypothetical protein U0359_25675 [Byssovorax sp.]